MNLVETAYILSFRELSFFKNQSKYSKLSYLEADRSESDLVRNASALLSLQAKGFVQIVNNKIIVMPIIDLILTEMCFGESELCGKGEIKIIGKVVDILIKRYRLQQDAYRIVVKKKER